ncbi:1-deoxy-D-xylulose-5-phosphate synthase [Sansalvadorimonas sp. 2012CJ34-2]|uniref:1-deoxy-D-xylulose-5-phosphate synthase n=1 Tax=Parendozoicomonas callyspongiae TaxID=2942213 RepID=A0ABT0PLE7_9GAMM|nr:1-deoxy-D-xylulose-5-phosphate synthase [Sansalvadorimonas sp. 2012CJ34-2]MCL6272071.1 1-deoxy-D-xylulose-5-phosphate synthase [Sansalvadorimonas sp. 2012CJ34-2]
MSDTGNNILDLLSGPADLRRLKREQLPQLADELRGFLIESVYQTGGHLGAGLGVVELTIALHYVFNTPEDRLIWDVGHQCYPHKILTGRKGQMATLRHTGGMCGFPLREESEYDAFGTGHSSTSISAALGMAMAASAKGENRQAIAVIGDGAMTAGQAFEALNHAACVQANLLVILNDNDMSISPSVGMLAKYLRGLQSDVDEMDSDSVVHLDGSLGERGMSITGPVPGHHLPTLVDTLQKLKEKLGPKLLHVVTRKGRGLSEAEADPVRYHAVSKVSSSTPKDKRPTWANRFGQWLCAAAESDDRLFGITPAMREGSDLIQFSERFPSRYCDVAIAEQHAVTFAGGLACEGMKPVLAIYSTFLQRGYDQLIHDIALQNLDVLFAIDRAGLVGDDGPTHHGIFDIAALRAVPNMVLMAPSDEVELRQILSFGYDYSGPAAVRYPRGEASLPVVSGLDFLVELGKARVLRQGDNIALLAFGPLVSEAIKIAEQLSATVIDMRFIKPYDQTLVAELAASHSLLVTLEEGAAKGGIGEEVANFVHSLEESNAQVLTMGVPDRFIPHGSRSDQLNQCHLTAEGILEAITSRLEG